MSSKEPTFVVKEDSSQQASTKSPSSQPPTTSHSSQPPTTSHSSQPPTTSHSSQPPITSHSSQPPTTSHSSQPPPLVSIGSPEVQIPMKYLLAVGRGPQSPHASWAWRPQSLQDTHHHHPGNMTSLLVCITLGLVVIVLGTF